MPHPITPYESDTVFETVPDVYQTARAFASSAIICFVQGSSRSTDFFGQGRLLAPSPPSPPSSDCTFVKDIDFHPETVMSSHPAEDENACLEHGHDYDCSDGTQGRHCHHCGHVTSAAPSEALPKSGVLLREGSSRPRDPEPTIRARNASCAS